jgi:hypothetical protein
MPPRCAPGGRGGRCRRHFEPFDEVVEVFGDRASRLSRRITTASPRRSVASSAVSAVRWVFATLDVLKEGSAARFRERVAWQVEILASGPDSRGGYQHTNSRSAHANPYSPTLIDGDRFRTVLMRLRVMFGLWLGGVQPTHRFIDSFNHPKELTMPRVEEKQKAHPDSASGAHHLLRREAFDPERLTRRGT